MDFMQTMPAFVFMIPVIAFFGTGKPAAVVTTMIFGGTPVVRLTVLGLRGVPENVREAAISFGASKWYLLTKVDLPLAAPSIRAGVNQTIMLSLAMVVVASLIGAKGLGEDVLEALQYANVGQGILAGFAILFCAMMLDRIVQGRNRLSRPASGFPAVRQAVRGRQPVARRQCRCRARRRGDRTCSPRRRHG